ncbi:MAG: preprotein translocase subunit SecG [Lachnospiraceae bacterium]|nr:preprotein translocase subunit SecG [Lachnospiraceae bacterium]
MSTIGIVLTGVLVIVAIGLTAIILLQSGRAAGLGAMGATSSSSGDSYWSKNKGNSMEGALSKYTKIGGALFMIIAMAINFVR